MLQPACPAQQNCRYKQQKCACIKTGGEDLGLLLPLTGLTCLLTSWEHSFQGYRQAVSVWAAIVRRALDLLGIYKRSNGHLKLILPKY